MDPAGSGNPRKYEATSDYKSSSQDHDTDSTTSLLTHCHILLTDDVSVDEVVDIDPEIEQSICFKLDWRLLPALSIMYLFNSLDKSNLGNAKTDGIDIDLGFTGNQYNTLLSVFYAPYVLFAFPLTLAGKHYGVTRILPVLMFGFGAMSLLSAACTNWSSLMAIRWFLGVFESAFFPLVIFYLTTFYRRGELAKRLAIFYAASNIASAFAGLLSFAVFSIEGSSLKGWQWLFIIEGAGTIVVGMAAVFVLPPDVTSASFLTPTERHVALLRIQCDSSSIVNEPLNVREAVKVFKHPTAWGWLAIEICLGVPLQSVSVFLPQIVERLGYSTVKTNLFTVAPNISGALVLLLFSFLSDKFRVRSPFIAIGFAFPVIGFMIYLLIADINAHIDAAYFACFLMTAGIALPSVLLSAWFSNNVPSENKRAALTGVGVPLANLMGLVSVNVFREQDRPRYALALIVTAAFGAVGGIITVLMGAWMKADNARRERIERQLASISETDTSDSKMEARFRWLL
ncbi:major facilitator superfamily domain-containing protein [Limtongia smithiae]|uniref:major facilitator superfamily domain-containing protein n=1 Tax=Limtongia smithiae TaxID=1125753 RepID=UPI0034CFC70D